MTDAETDTDREQIPTSRHALAFLSALLDMTADELGRVNTAIRAARDAHLHPGAGAVMAEGIANQEIARMLEQLEQKRRKEQITQYTGLKGKTRQQIIAEAAERREQRAQQLERNRQERAKIRAARQMQREAEKLERKRQREQIRAARKQGGAMEVRPQGTAGEDKAPASITKTTQGAKVEPLPGHIRRAIEALLAPYGLTLEAIAPADQRGGDPHTITAINNSGEIYGLAGINYGTVNIIVGNCGTINSRK